ncbi:hypothetical protein TNCV_1883501 [Trichonephila clavipes]|nr:hypothetical protein TNCV_1883501 [Trichonephila clavipes]
MRLGGCEVACPPRKPKIAGSIAAGVDRFSESESRMIMWDVKDLLGIHLALELSAKLNHDMIQHLARV